MSSTNTDLIQYLRDKLGHVADHQALDERARTLDKQRESIAAAAANFQLLPGLQLVYTPHTDGQPQATVATSGTDIPPTGHADPAPHSSILQRLGELLHAVEYESRADRSEHLAARAARYAGAAHCYAEFAAAVTTLSHDDTPALHYYLHCSATDDPAWRLGMLLCGSAQLTETDLLSLQTTPQYLPPADLVALLAAMEPHPSKRVLLVHLRQTHQSQTLPTAALVLAVAAATQLSGYSFQWIADHSSTTTYPTTDEAWFWPFRPIENDHIPDTHSICIHNPAFVSAGYTIGYASVPYENSRQQHGSGEDFLRFHTTGHDDVFAVLADGASQSALGGVAADVFTRMCMRFNRAHPQVLLYEADFLAICALAAAEARYLVHARIAAIEQNKNDATVFRILRKRNTVGGSQAVFAIVQKIGKAIRVVSAGNVRVIIPGYIEHDAPVFASDDARFASLPENGLIGEYHTQQFSVTENDFTITILSDALEGYAGVLARRGFLDEGALHSAATADDTTYITFRYAPLAH